MSYNSHIWHPYTRFSALDTIPVITRGKGIYLFDAKGNRYIDGISSWWSCNLGHSNSRVIAAIEKQVRILQHSILGNLSHPGAIELAAKLVQYMPDTNRHVLFSSDGASAVEAALKVAVQYFYNIGQREREYFVSLHEPYHGDTLGAVSIGYMESYHKPIKPLLFDVFHVPAGDPLALDKLMSEQKGCIAGVVLESMCQGASGMRMYSAQYLKHVEMLCRKHGCFLILDEIAMGFGRTGKMFAFEHAGVDPDVLCVGKGLAGGYLPMSAAIFRDKIYTTFNDAELDRTFYHGHTFSGNPIAAAAALETLKVYEEEEIVKAAAEKGKIIHDELTSIFPKTRSLGMVNAFKLDTLEKAQNLCNKVKEKGLLLRPLGNTVYIMLPLIVTLDEIDKVIDIFKTCRNE